MEGLNDLANLSSLSNLTSGDIPFALIGSLFGLWFFAWIMGFLSAHLIRSVIDVFYRSVDD